LAIGVEGVKIKLVVKADIIEMKRYSVDAKAAL